MCSVYGLTPSLPPPLPYLPTRPLSSGQRTTSLFELESIGLYICPPPTPFLLPSFPPSLLPPPLPPALPSVPSLLPFLPSPFPSSYQASRKHPPH